MLDRIFYGDAGEHSIADYDAWSSRETLWQGGGFPEVVRFTPRHAPRLDKWSTRSFRSGWCCAPPRAQLALLTPSERARSPFGRGQGDGDFITLSARKHCTNRLRAGRHPVPSGCRPCQSQTCQDLQGVGRKASRPVDRQTVLRGVQGGKIGRTVRRCARAPWPLPSVHA